jgi:hypothetical protein
MKDTNDFLLTYDVTVGQARQWIREKDPHAKTHLISLIRHRFNRRYVAHLLAIDSGFLKMAGACLMIETLESFWQGKRNTDGLGKQMFVAFFHREKLLFPHFDGIAVDFYRHIRCGILHQAETTNAWRIVRKGDLLDIDNRAINAKKFVVALKGALHNYIKSLQEHDFNSRIWKNALLKIKDVCDNCEIRP